MDCAASSTIIPGSGEDAVSIDHESVTEVGIGRVCPPVTIGGEYEDITASRGSSPRATIQPSHRSAKCQGTLWGLKFGGFHKSCQAGLAGPTRVGRVGGVLPEGVHSG
jgi:hypothetical protein